MRLRLIGRRTLGAGLFAAMTLSAFLVVNGQVAGGQGASQTGSQGGGQSGGQGGATGRPQGPGAAPQQKIPDDERKLLDGLNTATDAAAKLQVGTEFLKKFSKSPRRPRVAAYLAQEVSRVPDNAQRIALAEQFSAAFKEPAEVDLVKPTIIDAQVKLSKFDEAFAEGAKYIPRHPDDVVIQTQLAIVGIEQAQRQNPKFVPAAQGYAAKAIELMETGAMPPSFDDAGWTEYKGQWLPRLYQAQGIVLYLTNDRAGAKAKFEKSMSLDSQNPSVLMMLGMLADDEYQTLAKQYNAEKGAGRDAILKQAVAKMDEVIELFARAVAAADGKAEFQAMNQQLMQNLESYYKFRHNGSSEGMSKIIDKYKKPNPQ